MKRYSLWVKSLVFFLAVVTLLAVAVSALGILFAEAQGMYNQDDHEQWLHDRYDGIASNIADLVLQDYGSSLSNCPQWVLEQTGYARAILRAESRYGLSDGDWCYIIKKDGKVIRSTHTNALEEDTVHFSFEKDFHYPVLGDSKNYGESIFSATTNEQVKIHFQYETGYQVEVWINRSRASNYLTRGISHDTTKWLFSAKYTLLAIAGGSILLFAASFIFLMSLAGKDPKTGEANPRALNRMPLDLYLITMTIVTLQGFICIVELLDLFFSSAVYNMLLIVLLCGCGIIIAAVDIGFFTAVGAQFKVPGGFWWRQSLCGRVLSWLVRMLRITGRGFGKLLRMLPVIWEWILIGAVLGLGLLFLTFVGVYDSWLPFFCWCLIGLGVICYGGWCYGTIRKGINRMVAGNLYEKINTQWMYGSFKAIAEQLNALAAVVIIAAEKQVKSERMKTDLITNVSHDIKTPLTSVINYVDLLQQPHTEEEGIQYLEVLSRQSQRLKKLVDDLMDMSKASSGNMVVNITSVDAVEAVNQALGEFADKLEKADLTPVFHTSHQQLTMQADGRLTWRVLSNLLSNVVKYALPGTRVYIDLLRQDNCVVLSMKNISREALNISAEELTERFVRGDTSRNTEGSGLGLNIAQSLMTLQRGDLELVVDGDLFKVTLQFPGEG